MCTREFVLICQNAVLLACAAGSVYTIEPEIAANRQRRVSQCEADCGLSSESLHFPHWQRMRFPGPVSGATLKYRCRSSGCFRLASRRSSQVVVVDF